MTYKSKMTNSKEKLIPPHGGYRKLASYQSAEIAFDLNVEFCNQFLSNNSNRTYKSYRTYDQMIQAGRSGKQNIAEASMASGTSKKTELKLLGVARASWEELLVDLEDFLRVNSLAKWDKDDKKVLQIRKLAYKSNRSHEMYKSYFENAEAAANCLICVINQTNFLLDRQLQALEKDFLDGGGFTENLYRKRREARGSRVCEIPSLLPGHSLSPFRSRDIRAAKFSSLFSSRSTRFFSEATSLWTSKLRGMRKIFRAAVPAASVLRTGGCSFSRNLRANSIFF